MRKPHSGVYGGMREGGCTEPSKLLSNEPQASCRNLRSGKFPRRPCCFPVFYRYLILSLSSLSLFSSYSFSQENSPRRRRNVSPKETISYTDAIYLYSFLHFSFVFSQFFFSILFSHFFFFFSFVCFFVRFSRCSVVPYRDCFPRDEAITRALPFVASCVRLRVQGTG